MTEADVRAKLVKLLRSQAPMWEVFRHEDHYTTGVPDISVTGNKRTSWWEVKLVDDTKPAIKQKGLKHEKMVVLAREGFARYIIFDARKGEKQIRVVPPDQFYEWQIAGHAVIGFDYQYVVSFIRAAHLS